VDAFGKIAVDVLGTGMTHIRIVVLGYLGFTGDSYTPVNPCAAFDSRDTLGSDPDNVPTGIFAGKRLAGDANVATPLGTTTYNVTGAIPAAQGGESGCGVPEGASAVLINLVAIQSEAGGNFRAYATGSSPTGGVLNFKNLSPALNNSNAVVVPLSAIGDMDVFVNAPTKFGFPTVHARGIIVGYYN
jgi:hypothetical protein